MAEQQRVPGDDARGMVAQVDAAVAACEGPGTGMTPDSDPLMYVHCTCFDILGAIQSSPHQRPATARRWVRRGEGGWLSPSPCVFASHVVTGLVARSNFQCHQWCVCVPQCVYVCVCVCVLVRSTRAGDPPWCVLVTCGQALPAFATQTPPSPPAPVIQ